METTFFQDTILPLADRLYPMVSRMLGNKENTEDAIQEIMLKLWDQRRKLIRHPNVTGLVFVTARNHCLDLLKKKRPLMDSSEVRMVNLPSEEGQEQFQWEELKSIIEALLMELPKPQRDVMMLRDMDGLEFTEIEQITGLKVTHLRVLLSRARKQIGQKLKKIYSYG